MRRLVLTTASAGVLMLIAAGSASGNASWSPSSVDFGQVAVGGQSAPKTVTLTDDGVGSGYTPDPEIYDDDGVAKNFKIVSNNCPLSLDTASCSISVVFAPTVPGALSARLWGNGTTGTPFAALSGTATASSVGATSKKKKCKKGKKSASAAKKKKGCKKKKK